MKKVVVFSFLYFCLKLSAAAPLTHLYAAQLWNDYVEGFNKEESCAFFLGNLFPDIRYLAEIPREMTHINGVSFRDVKEHLSPFVKGLIFHSVIDELREHVVIESEIYSILEDVESEHLTTLLKLVEDEILWDMLDGKQFLPFLKSVIEEELQTGISPDLIRKWHFFLGYYLGNRPSHTLYSLALMDRPFLNIPSEIVQRWFFLLPQLAENPLFRTHVESLLEYIQLAMSFPPEL